MIVIRAENVHQALPLALKALVECGVKRDSRNGPVLVFPEPVTTVYRNPTHRVLFWPDRDANPFFHFLESLWMLAGRNDVEYVARIVENMRSYSDDGTTFHGAYGKRWRNHFSNSTDQLNTVIENLKKNPDDRRQVVSMWDAEVDLNKQGKDLPCNLQVIFQITADSKLDMMVTNRSNDLVWGCYGANAVHFSYLQEYVASCVGVEVGVYRQVSANLHAYEETLTKVVPILDKYQTSYDLLLSDPYCSIADVVRGPTKDVVSPYPLINTHKANWDDELLMFMDDPKAVGFKDPFFRKLAVPLYETHRIYKETQGPDRYLKAIESCKDIVDCDWALACRQWLERRYSNYLARLSKAQDDGVNYDG